MKQRRSLPNIGIGLILLSLAVAQLGRADDPAAFNGDDTIPFTGLVPVLPLPPAFNEHCVISVLNRIAQVRPDGKWIVQNVPTNFGLVRARATCLMDGTTFTGQSAPFLVPQNGFIAAGEITFDEPAPIPTRLQLTAPTATLTAVGSTTQISVAALFPDGSTQDVTTDATTSYVTSNPAIATVNSAGVVTSVSSGPVLITVLHEAVSGFLRLTIRLPNADTDGDGIPDTVELSNGLDPNNPVDGFEDIDGDGLTNKQELVDLGTNFRVADSDGDGLNDGREVALGTNPLAADTDGDGVRDGLEVQTGSDPLDPTSFNLARALSSIEVTPSQFTLTFNTIYPDASRQLVVTGHLLDGATLNLTSSAKGTRYSSSDLTICNFSAQSGRVFAGADGVCTITITNSNFSTQTVITVQRFSPRALSFVDIPGSANDVDVRGNFAYVAAGSAGLQVVDVSDHLFPEIVGSVALPRTADDIQIVGTTAFVADGAAGLQIIDIQDPLHPVVIGAVDTPGDAQDLVVKGNLAFVADGLSGLQVIDVNSPTAPQLIGSINSGGMVNGVDVAPDRPLVVVTFEPGGSDNRSGVKVIDVTDPQRPSLLGSVATGDARDVAVKGNFAFVGDYTVSFSFTSIDISDPRNPVVRASTNPTIGGLLNDIALAGRFAFGADKFFVNGVPIIDVSTPEAPIPRAILDFSAFGDDTGRGIAVDNSFVYLIDAKGGGALGSATRLFIGQYQIPNEDTAGIPPTVKIIDPLPGEKVVEGSMLPITVEALDDVAVETVDFLVDGAVVFTDASAPYQFRLKAPAGPALLTLAATASDLGGNIAVAQDIVVNVIPDPLTTVVGQVIDTTSNPVGGATVTCLTVSGLTAIDGSFSISGAPTNRGSIRCTATFTASNGSIFKGKSLATPPVGGGVTDVGTITARATTFTVDSTADASDATPGDGRCATSTGVCTLRAALQEANVHAGDNEIHLPAGSYVLTQSVPCIGPTFPTLALCISGNLTVTGDGAATTIIDGSALDRVLLVRSGATATINGVTITNGSPQLGSAFLDGGGIRNSGVLTLIDSVITGNTAPSASGGIANYGTLNLINSTVSNNTAIPNNGSGGGISNQGAATLTNSAVSGNKCGASGGGIFNSGGALTMTNSTVSGNTATVANTGLGGGIFNNNFSTLTATNSTISGNMSNSSGGGVFNSSPGAVVNLNNVTIVDNAIVTNVGQGGGISNNGVVNLANTLIARNTQLTGLAPDCLAGSGAPLNSQGYNLIQNTTGCAINGDSTGNLTGHNPHLSPLEDNGGPTQTHALLTTSPAIDTSNPTTPGTGGAACAATDQRGIPRPQPPGGRCDIGAYEKEQ